MSKVKKEYSDMAIYRDSSSGPNFSFHIYIADNADSNGNSAAGLEFHGVDIGFYPVPTAVTNQYTVLAGSWYFSPDEVEVFYLDPSR